MPMSRTLIAFMSTASLGCRAGLRRHLSLFGCCLDHSHNLVLRELDELVAGAGRGGGEQAEDERSLLLEEEQVARVLAVEPVAHDSQGLLVEVRDLDVGVRFTDGSPARRRLVDELANLVVEELVGALGH